MSQISLPSNNKILVPSGEFSAGQARSLNSIVYTSNVVTCYLITQFSCSFLNTPIHTIIMRTCDPKKILVVLILSSVGSGLVSYEISTIMTRIFKEENLQAFKERNAGKVFLGDDGKLQEIPMNFKKNKAFCMRLVPPKKVRTSFLISILFGNKFGISFLICLFVKDRFTKKITLEKT